MAPRSALAFASFAVAFCVVHPGRGDEPAELPPLPPPEVSAAPTTDPAAPPASAPPVGSTSVAVEEPPASTSAAVSAAPTAAAVSAAPVDASASPRPGPGEAPDDVAIALARKRARVSRSSWSRDTSLGAIGVGGGLVGAGWILSVIHGLLGEIAGVDCHKGNSGYTATLSCDDTDDYGPIFIPVVGPFAEAASHKGTLSDADKGFLAIEGILQAGGVVTALVGLASLPVTLSSDRVSVTVAPAFSAKGASLGLTGSF